MTRHKPVHLSPPGAVVERRPDGTLLMRSRTELDPLPAHYGAVLDHWADRHPERLALAERRADGDWITATWAELRDQAARAAAGLLALGLPRERPIAVIAAPSIKHAALMFGASQIGIPIAPLAPAYAGSGADLEKLEHILGLLDPALVAVDDGPSYEAALTALAGQPALSAAFLHFDTAFERLTSTPLADLLAEPPGPALEAARGRVGPDDCAKILFTSGSTGMPKGVVTTHRMLLANQQAFRQVHPYLAEHPPQIVDWLPWNHCHAGNFSLGCALYNGGTYHMARGVPVGDKFGPVLDAMAEHPPTIHLDVPQGYDCLAARLDADDDFNRRFFSRLDTLFYAGSSMPEPLWRRLEAASQRAIGETIVICSGYGSTETTPLHTMSTRPAAGPRYVGTPVPGAELLLLPAGDRYEIRVRGDNVTPGYLKDPQRNREAFDDDGFFITGDAMRFVAEEDPDAGLIFEGRVGLNFKLLSGTWVRVDTVRVALMEALGPLARDVLVAGHDQPFVAILIFPELEKCLSVAALDGGAGDGADRSAIATHQAVRDAVTKALLAHNESHSGSSRRVARALILNEPPDLYDAEVTDKRYLNQRAALAQRADMAARLFAEPPDDGVIVL